jgi:hypothetical protein
MNALDAAAKLAECAWAIRPRLRRCLHSAFSDEYFMRSISTLSEWRDHLRCEKALLLETTVTGDPASAIYGSASDAPRITSDIARRVAERERRFGSVASLFSSADRRHLAELSESKRKLAYILERRNGSQYHRRSTCLLTAKLRENTEICGTLVPHGGAEFLIGMINEVGGQAGDGQLTFSNPRFGDLMIFPEIDELDNCLRISCLVAVGCAEKPGKFGLHRLLPGAFQSYMICEDPTRRAVSYFAWRLALRALGYCWNRNSRTGITFH